MLSIYVAVQVDKRGRRIASSQHADQLKRFYRVRTPSPTTSSSRNAEFVDYARGQGTLSSSGSEHEDGDDVESEVEEEELELGPTKRRILGPDDDDETDSDSENESRGSQIEIYLSDEEDPSQPIDMGELDGAPESVTTTKRIAAVNLDWDNLRAGDLFAAFNSFLKAGSAERGTLLHVRIYPSEFGKGRMEREEAEGPGGGIFLGTSGQKKKDRRKEGLFRHEDHDDDDEDIGGRSHGWIIEHDEESLSRGVDDDDDGRFDEGEENSDEGEDEDGLDEDHGTDVTRANGHAAKEIDGLEIVSDVSSEVAGDDVDMDQLRQYQLERLQ